MTGHIDLYKKSNEEQAGRKLRKKSILPEVRGRTGGKSVKSFSECAFDIRGWSCLRELCYSLYISIEEFWGFIYLFFFF